MSKIYLSGIKFFAHHGFYETERRKGGEFEVDLTVQSTFSKDALEKDEISGTLNYEILYLIVKEEMNEPAKLLEHLAHRIVSKISSLDEVEKVKVKVKKLTPPFDGEVDHVAVELES